LPSEAYDFLAGAIAGGAQCDLEETSILRILASVQSVGGSPIELFVGLLSQRFLHGTGDLLGAMIRDARLEIRFEQPVVEVVQGEDVVEVRTETGEFYRAAACVLATPASTVQDIAFQPDLPGDRSAYLTGPSRVHGVKKLLIVENVPAGLFCIGGISARYQWLWEERALTGGRTLLCAFGMHKDTNSNDLELAQSAVAQFVPEARVVGVDGENWFDDPYSRGVLRYGRPGYGHTLGQKISAPHGRVLFAGTEFTDKPLFWGWIEGAIDRGHVAAHEAAALLGSAGAQ
ncbi:FAD-dependent oxidoreductase, partial [Jatrophihabitans sp.]|uniref:FAD-dependent oxidoreductase n=1 Tax=Jatrophihabitans sp. TaxID=1932789 RepID=UPI0030C67B53|nr:monoamine oxidase [Jatrophihabitans sp.]